MAILGAAGVVLMAALGCREHVDEHTLPPGAHRGEVLYTNHCVACHGIDGRGRALPSPQGDTVVSRDFVTKAFQTDRSDEDRSRAIREGVPSGSGPSPAFPRVGRSSGAPV